MPVKCLRCGRFHFRPITIRQTLQHCSNQVGSSCWIRTLTVLRQLESTIRGDLSAIAHFEKLSDELIAPNLDHDISFFYDPATKKLRKRFEKYPQALDLVVKLFHDMETTQTDLLKQIQAERKRH